MRRSSNPANPLNFDYLILKNTLDKKRGQPAFMYLLRCKRPQNTA